MLVELGRVDYDYAPDTRINSTWQMLRYMRSIDSFSKVTWVRRTSPTLRGSGNLGFRSSTVFGPTDLRGRIIGDSVPRGLDRSPYFIAAS
jgi:hypothetical protein